ncbi:gp017 (endogenous virus) [Lactococcus phage KSY1]|uniref:Gp017 n=1 Tax=Lactococcus phage KSY1 TaxID=2913972 RepID=A6MA81_9CAUD|nr:gp017 [Lactococcus phage KSY1]ABG21559.1 gp017 [Lactococcus phage KSY1]
MKINAKIKSHIQREILNVVDKIINNQSEGNKCNEM